MHKENLPQKVDPFRFAENAIHLQGTLPIKKMERLCTSLSSNEGDVAIEIEFGVDEQGIRFVKGNLTTHLTLQCQRCMQAFDYGIIADFKSGIVRTGEEADKLPTSYDPLVVAESMLNISEMIEEELIVSLPIVPMHKPDDCKIRLPLVSSSTQESDAENPFRVIESLRKMRNPK